MNAWLDELIDISTGEATNESVFDRVAAAGRVLGFEHCAYGVRVPMPWSRPTTVTLNTYPQAWGARYHDAGYLDSDPTVLHGRRSRTPVIWSDDLFFTAPALWDEARSFDLKVGWAQSHVGARGEVGMLSLSRANEAISANELELRGQQLGWLACVAHFLLTPRLSERLLPLSNAVLSAREIEVLQWTADGKSAQEIADILHIAKGTVDFHAKNASLRLGAANKTAAAVKAAMLGLLS